MIRGVNVMRGYFERPEGDGRGVRGGWLHTGDLGYRDEDGFFFIVDRKKDLIIRGGYNVYPREIEEVLYTHPAVAEAAVVGVPDERLGEEIKAYVETKPAPPPASRTLIEYVKERVAAYKYPRMVEFRADLPKGPTGKILKKELSFVSVMTEELRDGSCVVIRPIEPDDRAALADGFERLSAESRYRRFFAPVPHLSEHDLDYLTCVDHHDHEALVAVADATGEGVGVARYVRTGPDVAEPAIVVVDDWQGRGVGSRLLDALVERARRRASGAFRRRCSHTTQMPFTCSRGSGRRPGRNRAARSS